MDRAALDAAIWLGIEHGGWCPQGRRAEDGMIAPKYQLQETLATNYAVRTEQNVIDSDGTLILATEPLTGGTAFTLRMARRHQRPWLLVDLFQPVRHDQLREWLLAHDIDVLNVAGPRESGVPGIGDLAREYLIHALEDE